MGQIAGSTRPHRPDNPGRPGWIDLDGIRDRIDLEALATALLGPAPGRRGQRGARRLWWHCPFHEDANPSFCVTPLKRLWRCFGCAASGDAVGLVMRVKNWPFLEAIRWLDEFHGPASLAVICARSAQPASRHRECAPASTQDHRAQSKLLGPEGALGLVEAAARRLWAPGWKDVLGTLYRRGLADPTIQRARLGFIPVMTELADRPGGIVIPWFERDKLTLVKLRQPDGRRPKYRELYRDGPRLFPGPDSIRADCALVMVEGEFDALLLGQELEDLAAVVTLGSASSRLDRSIADLILGSPAWYVATDHDAAGNQAAAQWPARARRVLPPEPHKDWTEAYQNGIDLRRFWMGQLGIEITSLSARSPSAYPREERAAIMEHDGQLTREAAERAAGLK
jgi:DNA primase